MSTVSGGLARASPLLDDAPLPMLKLAGPGHRVSFVNDAFCALLGEKREALIGRPFVEIVANGESCAPVLDRVLETGRIQVLPAPAALGGSDPLWLYALWPALDANARPVGVIVQLTRSGEAGLDIAAMNGALLIGALRQHELREASEVDNARLQTEVVERLRVQRTLLETQAYLKGEADRLKATVAARTAELRASVAQMEAFSYTLAHDLRAPVRAIQSFAQLALELPRAGSDPGAEYLKRIVTAAARMEELIQDVLNLNRVAGQPVRLAPIEVEALVRALVAENPALGPDRADVSIEGPLPPMLGHESSFGQCLANLLENAVKFVAPGARPRVRVRAEEIPARADKPEPGAAPTVRLWVEDEGIGIAPEDREKIFEMFQRLHGPGRYAGTGIGLAIVRKAIGRMGGRAGMEPGLPNGSRFWLELPRA